MKDSTQTLLYFGAAGVIIFLCVKVAKALEKKDIPSNARRVACLGDSITAAAGGYCSRLKALLPAGSTTKAFGYEGKGTGYILGKVDLALAWEPTDLVVLAGVNDMPGAGAVAATENLGKIYAKAHAANVRVVAVQILPWFCYYSADVAAVNATTGTNDWIEHESTADAVVSTWALGDGNYCLAPNYDSGAGLHPNALGQQLLAELIADQAFRW